MYINLSPPTYSVVGGDFMCHSGILPAAALISFGVGILFALLIGSVFVLIVAMLASIIGGIILLQK